MGQKPKSANPIRQDMLRGIRWGVLLVVVLLLSIAFYRLTSGTASARQTDASPEALVKSAQPIQPEEATPAEATQPLLEVSAPSDVKDLPAPERAVSPGAWKKTAAKKAPPKAQTFVAPTRIAPAAEAPPRANLETVDASTLPKVQINATPEPTPTPIGAPALAPPPDDPSVGTRARGIVRSVGRILRFGRRNNEQSSSEEEKKK